MEVNEYTIVRGRNPEELAKKVNDMIQEGWQPQGGLDNDRGAVWSQAMVR